MAVVVVPGERVGSIESECAGNGTYVRGSYIYASLNGTLLKQKSHDKVQLYISPSKTPASTCVLQVGDQVLCTIITLSTMNVDVIIHARKEKKNEKKEMILLPEGMPGIIRREDAVSKDSSIALESIFKPTQVVLATVRSYGDRRAYYLSTAHPHLGIVKLQSKGTNV